MRKPRNDSARPAFRTIDNTGMKLAEVDDYRGAMAVLVESLERQGVRFDEASIKDGEITHLNNYVTIIRGDAAELLYGVYKSVEGSTSRE